MRRNLAVLLFMGGLIGVPRARAVDREPDTYLKKVGFTDADLAEIKNGKVVSRLIPDKDDNQAFVLGVARVAASPEKLVTGIRTIESLKRDKRIEQIGRFGTPPKVQDMEGLSFEPEELEDFSKCRVADCEIQAPADGMALAKKIDWKAPNASAKATEMLKVEMVHQLEAYLDQGSSAMVVYNNNVVPVSVRDELNKILENSPNLAHYNPAFLQYIRDFPHASLPDSEDLFYWSKEKLRKPVVSVCHICIQKVTQGAQTGYFVGIKHVYDSHYFLADLEFLTLVPDETDKTRFYLLDAVRARIDPPRKLRGLLLAKIKGAMKDALAEDVATMRRKLEGMP